MHLSSTQSDFLRAATLTRFEIDRFLDESAPSWARYDSELGYVPNTSRVPDNIDGAISTYTYGALGERTTINHAAAPCRLSTYGDSMTQCHQVSDGQTWQESLAAQIGEPIRNFGVGGYGVYQAVNRLRRIETTLGSDYVLLNIFHDDHYRSIDSWRLLRIGKFWRDYDRSLTTSMFHANPWDHLRFNAGGELIRRRNVCPTPKSLYRLTDPDFVLATFGDDLVTEVIVGQRYGEWSERAQHRHLAEALGMELTEQEPAAESVWRASAYRSSTWLLADLQAWLNRRNTQLAVALTYPQETIVDVLSGGTRPDAAFLDALQRSGIPFFDVLEAHRRDFADFAVDAEAYLQRLMAGHYTPAGNHFFAMALRHFVIDWLSPAPPAYRDREASFASQAARLA